MNAPRAQLLEFFRELFLGDDVVELRVLKKVAEFQEKKGTYKESLKSVYHHFPARDLEAFIKKAEWYNRQGKAGEYPLHGIYFTVHALKPEMLKASRYATDDDVRSFKVLFHDLDVFLDEKKLKVPVQAYTITWNGHSIVLSKSWAVEHGELAQKFKRWLGEELVKAFKEELDWDVWVVVDSGFGLHVYEKFGFVWFAERAGDYKTLFDAIRQFLIDKLQELLGIDPGIASEIVDEKVYNPSRIVKFPGSINGKRAFRIDPETGKVQFYPEELVEGGFIYFDPDAVLTENQIEEFLSRLKRARKAQLLSLPKPEEDGSGKKYGLHYEDDWVSFDDFKIAWDLSGLDLGEDSIEEITKRLVFFYWEGKRNELFLKLPNLFLFRGISGRTVIRIFDRLLKVGVELGLEDEGEIKNQRILPVLTTIRNFIKARENPEKARELGWRSYFFEIPGDKIEYEELMQRLRELWKVQNPRKLKEKLGVWKQQLEALELKNDVVSGVRNILADSPQVAKEYLGVTIEELEKKPWEEQKAIVRDFIIKNILAIFAEIEMVKRFARVSKPVSGQIEPKLEEKLKEDAEKWAHVREKLGIGSELLVFDFLFRDGESVRSIQLLGSGAKTIWNPEPEFVEKLADSIPASVEVKSLGDYKIEPLDFETLKNLASWSDFETPFIWIEGVAKISASGNLYIEVGGTKRFFVQATYNAKKLEGILRKYRIKELPVELIALALETEDGGQIYALTADWDRVRERAKEKRDKIEQILNLKDREVPEKGLKWGELSENVKLDIAKHYLKVAVVREGSALSLLSESFPHHPKAFVLYKPEGSRKFKIFFNAELVEEFLEELGFQDPKRPILAQDLERAILEKFPQLKDAFDELLLEAIEPYLAPGHQYFDEKEGEIKEIGKMRVPECIPALLRNLDKLEEEHIELLARYIKFYSKGLPVSLPEEKLRKGEKPDARLALWGWIVRRLGGNLKLLATFKKYYEKVEPPFTCPGKQGKGCPFLELDGQLPLCPFLDGVTEKVERAIALIDKVEIQAPDAIVIYFGDNKPVTLDGIDITRPQVVEQFRGWLVATMGEHYTKGEAAYILHGLYDRGHIVESEFSEEADVAEQFNVWLQEVAKRGVLSWEAKNAKSLFFDPTKQVVYIPTSLFMSFLGMLGRTSRKGLNKQLKMALGKYLVSLSKRLPPIPDGPGSQSMVRPYAIVIRREYFEKVIGVELKEREILEEIEELPPEEGGE